MLLLNGPERVVKFQNFPRSKCAHTAKPNSFFFVLRILLLRKKKQHGKRASNIPELARAAVLRLTHSEPQKEVSWGQVPQMPKGRGFLR